MNYNSVGFISHEIIPSLFSGPFLFLVDRVTGLSSPTDFDGSPVRGLRGLMITMVINHLLY